MSEDTGRRVVRRSVIDTSGWPHFGGGSKVAQLQEIRRRGIRLVAGDVEYLWEMERAEAEDRERANDER